MEVSNLRLIAVTLLLVTASCNSQEKFDPSVIPPHQYFIKKNISWQPSPYDDPSSLKAVGPDTIDTMIIATSEKLILITGQYGLKPGDTIIMPYSGEFGIKYEVLSDNSHHSIQKSLIDLNGNSYVRSYNAKFEWWEELISRINKSGKGKIVVSGP